MTPSGPLPTSDRLPRVLCGSAHTVRRPMTAGQRREPCVLPPSGRRRRPDGRETRGGTPARSRRVPRRHTARRRRMGGRPRPGTRRRGIDDSGRRATPAATGLRPGPSRTLGGHDSGVARRRGQEGHHEEVRRMTSTDDRADQLHAAGLDGQNRTALGRMLGTGERRSRRGGGRRHHACHDPHPGGRAGLRPEIVVFPHGGEVELTLINDDKNTHCAVLPHNGDPKIIWLVNHSKGTATPEPGRPGHLLVRVDDRQRRGPRPDRRPRLRWRGTRLGQDRPSPAAASVREQT